MTTIGNHPDRDQDQVWDFWLEAGLQPLTEAQMVERREAIEFGRYTDCWVWGLARTVDGWSATLAIGDSRALVSLPPMSARVGDSIRVYVGIGGRLTGIDLQGRAVWHLTEEEALVLDPPSCPYP